MNTIRTLAMYLPQFHQTKENDEWWGEGYTEWTAVRKAKKLYEGHNQPRIPLDNRYYDLLEKDVMKYQAAIAKEYSLDGFCFYHYYFKDGQKVLEKPAENLLGWKDVDMPFCFCWANETWARTWSSIQSKNVWSDVFEKTVVDNEKDNGILLEQRYGREEAWKNHFDYMLPFFLDERYIKFEGKPIFLIYKPQEIYCLPEMIAFWQREAKKNGLAGLYVIGANTIKKQIGLDAILFSGPSMYWLPMYCGKNVEKHWINGVRNYEYDELWSNALLAKKVPGIRTYYGAFTDYDDTPRRGENGIFLKGSSVAKFEENMYKIMKKNLSDGNTIQFINAFNEWGEGMYLEPDQKNGYRLLQALSNAKKRVEEEKVAVREKNEIEEQAVEVVGSRAKVNMRILDQWLYWNESGKKVSDYLIRYGYKTIAIYGIGILGKHLFNELQNAGIEIAYIIDKKQMDEYKGVKVIGIEGQIDAADAIVVTPVFDYDEIWLELKKKSEILSIISLEELFQE